METNRIRSIAAILTALLFVSVASMTVAERTSAPPTTVSTEGETDHFWYRLAAAGPYIDSQRDNKAFGFSDGKIFLSKDNARTWPHSSEFPNAKNITFSCILKNGNILFATRTKLYLSSDNLKTHKQIIVKDQAGRDYLPHTSISFPATSHG